MSDLILESRDGDVVTLQFNDPDRLNAMSREMGLAFRNVVGRLALDASIRAVVLTGGGRAFSAVAVVNREKMRHADAGCCGLILKRHDLEHIFHVRPAALYRRDAVLQAGGDARGEY